MGDSESRSNYNKALQEYFSQNQNFERLSELSKIRLQHNHCLRILDSKDMGDIKLLENCPKIGDYLTSTSKSSFETIKKCLNRLNIDYIENPNLVRGLDYYTDLCFEIKYTGEDEEKPKDTLLGGGRYDLLVGQLRGQKNLKDQVPALGYKINVI